MAKTDFVHVWGTNPGCPVHVEMVATAANHKNALKKLARSTDDKDSHKQCASEATIEDGKLWIDVDLPNGCRVHVVLDPFRAEDCDEVLEYDNNEE